MDKKNQRLGIEDTVLGTSVNIVCLFMFTLSQLSNANPLIKPGSGENYYIDNQYISIKSYLSVFFFFLV